MTYNTLAEGPRFVKLFEEYADKEILEFNYRFKRITAELRKIDSDVVCLQEINFGSI